MSAVDYCGHNHCWKQLITIILLSVIAFRLPAQIDDTQPDPDSTDTFDFRHRVDFSAIYLNSEGASDVSGLLGYAYNLTPKSNVSLDVSYLGFSTKGKGGGIGDTQVTYAYTPNVKMSVKPWVPKKIGSGISLVLPTGKTSSGRSLDAVLVNPFIGGVMRLTDSIFLAPLLSYTHSLDQIATGKQIRLVTAELGVVWTSSNELWVGFYPTYIRDTEADESHLNLNLSVGTMFTKAWGASATYSDLEHFEPGVIPEPKQIFDRSVQLSIHYLF